jgi:hypothetical protein
MILHVKKRYIQRDLCVDNALKVMPPRSSSVVRAGNGKYWANGIIRREDGVSNDNNNKYVSSGCVLIVKSQDNVEGGIPVKMQKMFAKKVCFFFCQQSSVLIKYIYINLFLYLELSLSLSLSHTHTHKTTPMYIYCICAEHTIIHAVFRESSRRRDRQNISKKIKNIKIYESKLLVVGKGAERTSKIG